MRKRRNDPEFIKILIDCRRFLIAVLVLYIMYAWVNDLPCDWLYCGLLCIPIVLNTINEMNNDYID